MLVGDSQTVIPLLGISIFAMLFFIFILAIISIVMSDNINASFSIVHIELRILNNLDVLLPQVGLHDCVE